MDYRGYTIYEYQHPSTVQARFIATAPRGQRPAGGGVVAADDDDIGILRAVDRWIDTGVRQFTG